MGGSANTNFKSIWFKGTHVIMHKELNMIKKRIHILFFFNIQNVNIIKHLNATVTKPELFPWLVRIDDVLMREKIQCNGQKASLKMI